MLFYKIKVELFGIEQNAKFSLNSSRFAAEKGMY